LFRDEVLDKCRTSRAAIVLPSEFGVERDGSSNSSSASLACWRWHAYINALLHRGKIVRIRIETCANVSTSPRAERTGAFGGETSAVEEIDQNLSARGDDPSHIDRRNERAGIEQELAHAARVKCCRYWVEAIAVGTVAIRAAHRRFHSPSRTAGRIFRQQLPQTSRCCHE